MFELEITIPLGLLVHTNTAAIYQPAKNNWVFLTAAAQDHLISYKTTEKNGLLAKITKEMEAPNLRELIQQTESFPLVEKLNVAKPFDKRILYKNTLLQLKNDISQFQIRKAELEGKANELDAQLKNKSGQKTGSAEQLIIAEEQQTACRKERNEIRKNLLNYSNAIIIFNQAHSDIECQCNQYRYDLIGNIQTTELKNIFLRCYDPQVRSQLHSLAYNIIREKLAHFCIDSSNYYLKEPQNLCTENLFCTFGENSKVEQVYLEISFKNFEIINPQENFLLPIKAEILITLTLTEEGLQLQSIKVGANSDSELIFLRQLFTIPNYARLIESKENEIKTIVMGNFSDATFVTNFIKLKKCYDALILHNPSNLKFDKSPQIFFRLDDGDRGRIYFKLDESDQSYFKYDECYQNGFEEISYELACQLVGFYDQIKSVIELIAAEIEIHARNGYQYFMGQFKLEQHCDYNKLTLYNKNLSLAFSKTYKLPATDNKQQDEISVVDIVQALQQAIVGIQNRLSFHNRELKKLASETNQSSVVPSPKNQLKEDDLLKTFAALPDFIAAIAPHDFHVQGVAILASRLPPVTGVSAAECQLVFYDLENFFNVDNAANIIRYFKSELTLTTEIQSAIAKKLPAAKLELGSSQINLEQVDGAIYLQLSVTNIEITPTIQSIEGRGKLPYVIPGKITQPYRLTATGFVAEPLIYDNADLKRLMPGDTKLTLNQSTGQLILIDEMKSFRLIQLDSLTPMQVSSGDLKPNGLLYTDAQIENIIALLKNSDAVRFRKTAQYPYSVLKIINSQNGLTEYFAIYGGAEHELSMGRFAKAQLMQKIAVFDAKKRLGTDGSWQVAKTMKPNARISQDRLEQLARTEQEILQGMGEHAEQFTLTTIKPRRFRQAKSQQKIIVKMPLARGFVLWNLKGKMGRMSRYDQLEIGRQIIQAAKAAFDKAILHRDINSVNCVYDLTGEVKFVDWGLAIKTESLVHSENDRVGTQAFIAPEVLNEARDNSVTYNEKTEIYSLGILLGELYGLRQKETKNSVSKNSMPVPKIKAVSDSDDTLLASIFSLHVAPLLTDMTTADPAKRPDLNKVLADWQALQADCLKSLPKFEKVGVIELDEIVNKAGKIRHDTTELIGLFNKIIIVDSQSRCEKDPSLNLNLIYAAFTLHGIAILPAIVAPNPLSHSAIKPDELLADIKSKRDDFKTVAAPESISSYYYLTQDKTKADDYKAVGFNPVLIDHRKKINDYHNDIINSQPITFDARQQVIQGLQKEILRLTGKINPLTVEVGINPEASNTKILTTLTQRKLKLETMKNRLTQKDDNGRFLPISYEKLQQDLKNLEKQMFNTNAARNYAHHKLGWSFFKARGAKEVISLTETLRGYQLKDYVFNEQTPRVANR